MPRKNVITNKNSPCRSGTYAWETYTRPWLSISLSKKEQKQKKKKYSETGFLRQEGTYPDGCEIKIAHELYGDREIFFWTTKSFY